MLLIDNNTVWLVYQIVRVMCDWPLCWQHCSSICCLSWMPAGHPLIHLVSAHGRWVCGPVLPVTSDVRYLPIKKIFKSLLMLMLPPCYLHWFYIIYTTVRTTGSALAAASDIHRQMPTHLAEIRCDWLTNQNTDCCFVVIGLSTRQSHSPLQQLKIDPVRQLRSAILVGS